MSHCTLRLALVSFIALLAPLAAAQDTTPAELRREIEQLRTENEQLVTENEELAAENEALASQIASMRTEIESLHRAREESDRRIADLESRIDARPRAAEPDRRDAEIQAAPILRAEVPEDHLASPASLLNAVCREYEARFPNPPLTTEEQVADYRVRLDQWAKEVNQNLRGRTKWRVSLTEVAQEASSPRGAKARMTVLDPASGLPIGESFLVDVPPRMAIKLNSEPTQYYDLTLLLAPTPVVNPERRVKGVFEWPPFVGPMVEFAFDFEWGGIVPLRSPTDAASEAGPETPETPARP